MNEDPGVLAFGKFIPGFDFLKNLATSQAQAGKGAASPLAGLGNWVAPTVNEEELDKRIKELKAVLFWLEQNATALKATIQALEVQKMTLATLAGMNMSMAEVAKAFTIPSAASGQAPGATSSTSDAAASVPWPFNAASAPSASPQASAPEPQPIPEPEPAPPPEAPPPSPTKSASAEAAASGVADPLQWWGALTQQFQQIAAHALRDAAAQAPSAEAWSAAVGTPAPASTRSAAAKKKATAKAAPKKPAAKKAALKQPATKPTVAKTAAAKKPAAKKSAAMPAAGGWPLPPPFRRK